jgi:hypothetical protein
MYHIHAICPAHHNLHLIMQFSPFSTYTSLRSANFPEDFVFKHLQNAYELSHTWHKQGNKVHVQSLDMDTSKEETSHKA